MYLLDDTYMYDAARGGHWYDEPPYESDPDDFLMSGIGLDPAAATIQVSYTGATKSIRIEKLFSASSSSSLSICASD